MEWEPTVKERLTLNSRVVVSPNQFSAQLNGEVIVLDEQSGNYFGLDGVSARIWSLLQDSMTCADVVAILHEEYGTEQSKIEADLMRFVYTMREIERIDVQ
jgi:hypothetical protein